METKSLDVFRLSGVQDRRQRVSSSSLDSSMELKRDLDGLDPADLQCKLLSCVLTEDTLDYQCLVRAVSLPHKSQGGTLRSPSLRRVSIQKPASRISQLSRRENVNIFPNTNL